MKGIYLLLALLFLFSANLKSQSYSFFYNPYSGMNKDQLNLALEQSQKMKRNGVIWTAIGTGMFTGGAIMTFNGIQKLSHETPANFGPFTAGLAIMCVGTFPLVYGVAAWITGNEKVNMIEIQLLAFNRGKLDLKPTEHGFGLTMTF